MMGSAAVRGIAFGALCVLSVCGSATASGHHPTRAATAFSQALDSRHLTSFAGFSGSGRELVASRQGGWPQTSWVKTGSWIKSGSWIKTGRGGRFVTRFRGESDAVEARVGHSGGGIQCVTFARADTGIELEGNADTWWSHAAGLYQRGSSPEPGSVLSFRANGVMRLGHVSVVNRVVDSRTVEVDHANWGGPGTLRGGITRSISVVDVSPANDWTAVRVGLGHSGDYGSIYPTYGFIYNRPDRGVMVASARTGAPIPAPVPEMNPAPRDLRGYERDTGDEEVAEAPDTEGHSYAYTGGRYSRFGHHRHFNLFHGGNFHGATLRSAAFHSRPFERSAGHVTGRHHRS